jgi:serine/threonine-protein kinase
MSRLAAGGMAEVYLARLRGPMNFSKAVAVKVVHPHLTAQEEFLAMLLDEARLSALIKHPRVVDIYELGHADGVYFIAMEYIDGHSLTAVLQASVTGEPLDPLGAARIVADAADGLHAAHELRSGSGRTLGLVHRDVSPGNIMVRYDGGVKIVDFGIAKARGRLTVSGVQQFKGKAAYVAPEQLLGGIVDRRTDVYSLGVVLWEALTLTRLFPVDNEREALQGREHMPPSPSSVRPEVSKALSEICLKALRPSPDDRFQTAGELKEALDAELMARGFYRESGYVAKYMERVFARQQESRQKAVRKLSAFTVTADMPAMGGLDVSFDDDDDYPEMHLGETEAADAAAADEMARGTPVEPRIRSTTPVPARAPEPLLEPEVVRRYGAEAAEPGIVPRGRWGRRLVLAVLVIAIIGAGGWAAKIYLDSQKEVASAPARRRSASSKRKTKKAVPVPVPVAVTEAEPEAEPEPEREAEPEAVTAEPEAEPEVAAKPDTSKTKNEKEARPAAALYDEGAALFIQGKVAQAKERFKQAINADSGYAQAHRGLGLAYAAEGKREKAIKSFNRYLQLRPGASDAESIRKRIEQLQK